MDWLTFFAQVIASLAWPVTVVLAVLLLKDRISGLLPLLRRLKAGPVEAEFEREVQQIKDEGQNLLPLKDFPVLVDAKRQHLIEIAATDPRSAIAEAWTGVEFALKKAASKRRGESTSPLKAVISLGSIGALTLEEVAIFANLKGLRDQAIHASFSPTYESALNFIDLATRLQTKFAQLAEADN